MKTTTLKRQLKLNTTSEAARQLSLQISRLVTAIQLGRIEAITLDANAGVVRILQNEIDSYRERTT